MLDSMTIAQLEGLLTTRRTRLNQLARDRKKAQTKLDAIDRQISQLSGRSFGGRGGGGGRARNEVSLVAAMEKVLGDSSKPMRVGDISDAVMRSGYRSNSANFRGIVNQTLIKERKRFQSAGRGLYQMKK
jgi:hypothetical protein